MDGAKIRLSEEEKQLVTDSHLILTKNRVLAKANALLAQVMEVQIKWIALHQTLPDASGPSASHQTLHGAADEKSVYASDPQRLPAALANTSPKISRGDNYQGLPWLMLDHPRYFTRDETIALRCFFWWGNYFSITLQLEGNIKEQLKPALSNAFNELALKGYAISISEHRWDHLIDKNTCRSLASMDATSFAAHLDERAFVKLMLPVPLHNFESAAQTLSDESVFLLKFLLITA